MFWNSSPHNYLIGAASIISAFSAYRGWQRRKAKGAKAFTLLMVGVTIWSLGYAFETSATDLATKLVWARVQYLGIVVVPTAWFVFASQYSGKGEWVTPRNWALLATEPLIILTLVLTNDYHNSIWASLQLNTSGTYILLDYSYGWGFWLNAVYSYVLLAVATILLVRSFRQSSSLYRRQTGIILIGALAPWLGNVVYLLDLSPVPNLDLTPMAFTITGICVGWALFRYKLLELVPVARKAIVENMNAGVIVLDSQNRIIDINPFATRSISQSPETLIGQDIFRILTDLPDSVKPYKYVTEAQAEIPIGTGDTTEYFQLTISPLEDHHGSLIGRLIVFHKITELKRSEKVLQESESHFRSLFELAPDAQLLLDTSEFPKIVDANPAASEMYRYDREHLIGMPISRLVLPEDIGKITDWREKLHTGNKICYEGVHLTQDSSELSVKVQASLIEIMGKLFILSTHHDITDRLRTEETLRHRAEELTLLNDTFQDITTTKGLSDLFETIVERAVKLFKAEGGGLYLCDPERKETRCVVSYNTPNDYRGIVLQYGEGAAGMVAQSGEALIIDDYRKWSKRADVYEEEQPFSSMISAPLRWQDQVRGVIHVLHDSNTRRFTQNDLELLTLYANQATISIENTRFLETERQRSKDLEILRQASLELTSSLEPQSVFESILAYALKLVSADDAHIFIYSEGKLTFGAALWAGGRREEPFAEPREDGITYRVARSGERIMVEDMKYHHLFTKVNWEGAIIGLPLRISTEVVGVMNVAFSESHDFKQDEIHILELLADHAAIAINNARLFETEAKRRREEERLRQVTTALVDISETIGSTMEFQDALNAIVLAAHNLLPVDRVAVFLRDPSSDEFYPTLPPPNSPISLRLKEEQAVKLFTLRLNPHQMPLLQEMQRTHKPIVLNAVAGDSTFPPELAQTFEIRSLMISPIIIQNSLDGALYVDNTEECHTFTREEIDLTVGLARQASLALERSRLFKSANQRALELDALHAATTSLLSTIDLASLLNQIIEAAKRAIPTAEMGTLRLKNSNSGKLEVRAMVNFPNPQPREPYLKIEETFAASVIQEHNPLLIPNVNHYQSNSKTVETTKIPEIQSAIIAPLLFDKEAIGALSLLAKDQDAFTENDLRLLVSFAATASAAIRNAQLHAEVQALAITDSLTGVYNRRGLIELGTREVERAHRFNRPLTAIFMDLDHFKRVNDRFGHPIGDQVLRAIIQRCGKHIREVDILGRYGGEEFVVLLPEVNTKSGAKIAERLRQEVAKQPIKTDVGNIPITISLGVAEISSDIRGISALIEQADTVMYNAKKSGRNRVAVLHEQV